MTSARADLSLDDCINETCPWSGKPVDPASLTLYRGNVVGFCNTGCRDKFDQAVSHFETSMTKEKPNG
ncbi:MAG: glutathione S-transferase [Rhizobiales bacterium]|nr:glutathione S-transferase [Hyphomicrobiales bacterium]